MNESIELGLRTLAIGVGATAVMDVWALLLKRFGVRSLSFAFLGRWIGHWPRGRWIHDDIGEASPVRGERWLGWGAHYAIGVTFAALLVSIFGSTWVAAPSLAPALAIGVATVVAPLFVLQPALGLGVASRKTATPLFNATKSVLTHIVFGFGLYLAASGVAFARW